MSAMTRLFSKPQDVGELADVLREYECVRRFDRTNHIEAEVLAHGISELEESFHKLLYDLFPKFKAGGSLTEKQMDDLLHKTTEELRQVHYHIAAAQHFSFVCPGVEDDDVT